MESEFERLARVVRQRREKHNFRLTAWVFLLDHWHAILFPRFPVTVSQLMESIKVGSTLRINARRTESGLLWQPRNFDGAVGTVEMDWRAATTGQIVKPAVSRLLVDSGSSDRFK